MRLYWRLSWLFAAAVMKFFCGFRVFGAEKIPRAGGLLVACNHVSYLDPPLVGIGVGCREVYFLAKEGLFQQSRFFTWLITTYNAVPLRREGGDHRAIRTVLDLVSQGKAVVIFPEGTRSLSGELLPAKPGIGLLMMKADVPVVPCHLWGSNRSVRDLVLRRARLRLRFGDPIEPRQFRNLAASRDRSQAIGDEVVRRIRELGDK